MVWYNNNSNKISIDLKKCSETALKIVGERVVSAEAQTRTNEANITVP